MLVLEHDDFNTDNPEATEIQKKLNRAERLFGELENICSVSKSFILTVVVTTLQHYFVENLNL